MEDKLKSVVLVDDDACYTNLVRLVFKKLGLDGGLRIFNKPIEVTPYLIGLSKQGNSALPGLIILDMSMPAPDGFDLAAQIREINSLQTVPIVLMSSAFGPDSTRVARLCGINSCVPKPSDLDSFVSTFTELTHYWFSVELAS